MSCPTAIWERLRAANFHGSVAAPWQPTRSVKGLEGQQQGRQDISLRDESLLQPEKILGVCKSRSGQVHGRQSSSHGHTRQDPSLNQTAALKQGLFVSPSTEQWVWVSLPTGGEGCNAGLYWYRKPHRPSLFPKTMTIDWEGAQGRQRALEGFGPMSSFSLERGR